MLLQDNSVCPWIAFYPLVSKTQASFPTGGFFPLYVYFPTPVPKKKSATEHTWLHRQPQLQKEHEGHLFCYILQSKADITFRRSPPEQYSIARRGTSLTRKFISSGTSQAFTTLGWFNLSTWKAGWKLLTPLLEEWDNRLSTNYVLCFRYNFCFPNISLLRSTLQLVPTSIQMHKTRTLGIHKPVMRTKDVSKSRYRNLMMGIRAQVLDSCTFLAKSLYTCICFYTWEQFPRGPRVSQESVNTCVTVLGS